jgi:exodeoxyribonuclease VII small subunit
MSEVRVATFEDELAELERVVARLEQGGLALEDSVKLFEDGVRLSNSCKARLAAAESRIQKIVGPGRDGKVTVEDIEVDEEEGGEGNEEFGGEESEGRL